MTIAYLQPSCDCVAATAAKRRLQPGESTTVDVRLDAGRFSGSNEQNVRVKVAGPDFESTCKLVVSAVSQPDAAPAAMRRLTTHSRFQLPYPILAAGGAKGWHVPDAAKGVVFPAATPFAALRDVPPNASLPHLSRRRGD